MMGVVDYLPMAVNVVKVLSAVIVPPARACTAFECTQNKQPEIIIIKKPV